MGKKLLGLVLVLTAAVVALLVERLTRPDLVDDVGA
ncbi:hypothetical protein SY89_03397 [Halolamina pelagica]|uniref:Uncharacterized protein n=1 Tax=Halolamina pelagica TaxID=699431 RepID=A0A0N8HZD0_9EURY|nr:hypothetical protein SY89_03397 [Halolamina pelagica]